MTIGQTVSGGSCMIAMASVEVIDHCRCYILHIEICVDFIVSAATRRFILFCFGARPVKKSRAFGGAACSTQFSNVAYLFQTFFSKDIMF